MTNGKHVEGDPELEKLIDAQGRGRVDARGYRDADLPRFGVGRVPHNPYNAVLAVPAFAVVGVFLLVKLWPSWLGVILCAFFLSAAALSGFFILRRIPAWHRARRVAREYVAEHGGSLPRELRFWN